MNERFEGFSRRHSEGLLSGISAGFFFIVIGALFVITPNLFNMIVDFFEDFGLRRVPNLGIWLPVPVHPLDHVGVYKAVEQFCYVWGLFQIIILVLRFATRSLLNKKAETASNLVFWLGAGLLVSNILLETRWVAVWTSEITVWLVFWSGIIMLLGLSLIIRAAILAARPARRAF